MEVEPNRKSNKSPWGEVQFRPRWPCCYEEVG